MEPIVTGALIGAGANLLSGWLGSKSQESQISDQLRYQKEFAKHGIRWKVADAKAAGIHPLYALGANTVSYSPISVGGDPLARSISAAGQDIGRAVAATRTSLERRLETARVRQEEEREINLRLQNSLLYKELNNKRPFPGADPTQVIPGQSSSTIQEWDIPPDKVQIIPSQAEATIYPGLSAASQPYEQWSIKNVGGEVRAYRVLSKAMEEKLENDSFANIQHFAQRLSNYGQGVLQKWFSTPGSRKHVYEKKLRETRAQLPKHQRNVEWRYNALGGYWVLKPKSGKLWD